MVDIIVDTLLDGIKLLPFLFIAFLIIELVEHKLSNKNKKLITRSGRFAPIISSILGIFPQCGFSVMATNLYVTRMISLGTLIAVYLSTSDEMLPILISERADFFLILKILGIKLVIAIVIGLLIDFLLRKRKREKINYHLCREDHCHCHQSIFRSSFIHTIKTLLFIMVITFVLNSLFTFFGGSNLEKLFLKNSIFTPFLSSLVGLIPNCASSVMLTELFLNQVISFGSLVGGLLTGSGVAILVLFKANKNMKENMIILGLIYFIGVISGIFLDLFPIFF